MADARPRMTDAEFAAWLAAVRAKHAARPDPPVQVLDRPCERCGGRGWVDVKLIGYVRCSPCNSTGSAAVARAKRINAIKSDKERNHP